MAGVYSVRIGEDLSPYAAVEVGRRRIFESDRDAAMRMATINASMQSKDNQELEARKLSELIADSKQKRELAAKEFDLKKMLNESEAEKNLAQAQEAREGGDIKLAIQELKNTQLADKLKQQQDIADKRLALQSEQFKTRMDYYNNTLALAKKKADELSKRGDLGLQLKANDILSKITMTQNIIGSGTGLLSSLFGGGADEETMNTLSQVENNIREITSALVDMTGGSPAVSYQAPEPTQKKDFSNVKLKDVLAYYFQTKDPEAKAHLERNGVKGLR